MKVQSAPFGCIIPALFSFANDIKPLLLICPHMLLHIPVYLSSQIPILYLPFRFCNPGSGTSCVCEWPHFPIPTRQETFDQTPVGFWLKGRKNCRLIQRLPFLHAVSNVGGMKTCLIRHIRSHASNISHQHLLLFKKAKTNSHFWKSEKRVGE